MQTLLIVVAKNAMNLFQTATAVLKRNVQNAMVGMEYQMIKWRSQSVVLGTIQMGQVHAKQRALGTM